MLCERYCYENEKTSYKLGESNYKYMLNKGLLFKIYLELNHKKATQLNGKISKKIAHQDIQMANKHRKRSSSSFVIRELQVKTITCN